VVLNLLGECVSEARKAPVPHADSEVLSFNVAGADMLGIGRANQRILFAGNANCGAVPLLALGVGAVNLHDLSVVNFPAEGLHNRQKVHFMAVRSQLDSIRQPARNVIKERLGRLGIAEPK
jgi:hypothetical protein